MEYAEQISSYKRNYFVFYLSIVRTEREKDFQEWVQGVLYLKESLVV